MVTVLAALVAAPLVLAVVALSLSGQTVDTSAECARVRWMWVAAVVVGAAVAWWLTGALALGRGLMLVPAVLGLSVVVGVGLAETVVRPRRPAGPRTASLAARRVADYLPRALTGAAVGTATLHVATLVVTTMTASADDLGRAGRVVAARCGDTASAASPYPGGYYSLPLAAVLVMTGLASAAALTAVVRRPRGLAADDVGDDILRRRSATRVVAASGAALAASHAGIAVFAGGALLRMDCHAVWMPALGWALAASVPAALLLLGWFIGQVVAPGALVAGPLQPAVETR